MTTSIASAPNLVRVLAAIGDLLPGMRMARRSVRVIAMTGPAARMTAIAVEEATAEDRVYGELSDLWDLVVIEADRHPGGVRRRRLGRTIVLAVASSRIPRADACVDCT